MDVRDSASSLDRLPQNVDCISGSLFAVSDGLEEVFPHLSVFDLETPLHDVVQLLIEDFYLLKYFEGTGPGLLVRLDLLNSVKYLFVDVLDLSLRPDLL
jgi:hypothetical protein